MGLGALCVAAALVAPGLQAQESNRARGAVRGFTPGSGLLGSFTPAAADPKLAAILARTGLPDSGFRFTPSEARGRAGRDVAVAVRGGATRGNRVADRGAAATTPSLSLAPIAYNLGVSVGWKRFTLSGDMTRVELPLEPGSRERTSLGVSYTGKRVSGRVAATADRPIDVTPVLIGDKPSYSIDMAGSYSLTRNLDVTAGVRYQSDRERLPRLTEERRDSQAVYVGTAFRF